MKKETKGYTIRMSVETHAKLDAEAKKQDRSMNWVINDAINKYTKNGEKNGLNSN